MGQFCDEAAGMIRSREEEPDKEESLKEVQDNTEREDAKLAVVGADSELEDEHQSADNIVRKVKLGPDSDWQTRIRAKYGLEQLVDKQIREKELKLKTLEEKSHVKRKEREEMRLVREVNKATKLEMQALEEQRIAEIEEQKITEREEMELKRIEEDIRRMVKRAEKLAESRRQKKNEKRKTKIAEKKGKKSSLK